MFIKCLVESVGTRVSTGVPLFRCNPQHYIRSYLPSSPRLVPGEMGWRVRASLRGAALPLADLMHQCGCGCVLNCAMDVCEVL